MLDTALVSLGFILTPVPGLLALRLLLWSGFVTDGTEDRDVWFSRNQQTLHSYRSRSHKVLTWVTFFGVWALTLVLYVFLVDAVFANPPV